LKMTYHEFIGRVSQKRALDGQNAEVATQAVLSVLGEPLSDREIKQLSSQLAKELKRMLQNVLGHSRAYTAGEFVELVAQRESVQLSIRRLRERAQVRRALGGVTRRAVQARHRARKD
jgi:uncharacterized protein (DUF2267 family)